MAQPLTKTKRNGALYARPADIDAIIDEAEREDLETLVRRARIPRRSSPGFLPLESLVYIIRDARRRNDQKTMSDLMPVLLVRCEAILKAKITADDLPSAQEVTEEILGEFAVLFAEDGQPGSTNALDFFECRFNAAFRTFRLPYIKRERDRIDPLVSVPPQTDSSDDDVTDEDFFAQISGAFRIPENQIDHVLRNRLLAAINRLPADQRKALTLYYYYGFPEESDDPSVTSVASICGVTGRTIRNRLSRGVATLSKHFNQKGRTANEHNELRDTA